MCVCGEGGGEGRRVSSSRVCHQRQECGDWARGRQACWSSCSAMHDRCNHAQDATHISMYKSIDAVQRGESAHCGRTDCLGDVWRKAGQRLPIHHCEAATTHKGMTRRHLAIKLAGCTGVGILARLLLQERTAQRDELHSGDQVPSTQHDWKQMPLLPLEALVRLQLSPVCSTRGAAWSKQLDHGWCPLVLSMHHCAGVPRADPVQQHHCPRCHQLQASCMAIRCICRLCTASTVAPAAAALLPARNSRQAEFM